MQQKYYLLDDSGMYIEFKGNYNSYRGTRLIHKGHKYCFYQPRYSIQNILLNIKREKSIIGNFFFKLLKRKTLKRIALEKIYNMAKEGNHSITANEDLNFIKSKNIKLQSIGIFRILNCNNQGDILLQKNYSETLRAYYKNKYLKNKHKFKRSN